MVLGTKRTVPCVLISVDQRYIQLLSSVFIILIPFVELLHIQANRLRSANAWDPFGLLSRNEAWSRRRRYEFLTAWPMKDQAMLSSAELRFSFLSLEFQHAAGSW